MFSNWPSESSTQLRCSRGIRRRSSGAIPSLAMCQVSIARPPLAAPAALHQLERRVERVDVDVERHELVDDLGVGVLRGVPHSSANASVEPVELARRAGDVADLDVMGVERRGGVEQQPAPRVGLGARRVAGRDEEVGQELDLEIAQAGVVEDLLHLGQRAGLELVLDVGVPQPEAPEADPRGVRAAVAPVERAPFPADVHVGRTGHGPVQGQQLGLSPSSLLPGPGRSSYRRHLEASSHPAPGFLPISAPYRPGDRARPPARRCARSTVRDRSRARSPARIRRPRTCAAASPAGSRGPECR